MLAPHLSLGKSTQALFEDCSEFVPNLASGCGRPRVGGIEKSDWAMTGYVSTMVRIQAAFEEAGIQFIDDDENGGYGLRLAKKKRKR